MRQRLAPVLFGLIVCACHSAANAWLRFLMEDADVVARSELIVIGGIKDGSVVSVPHDVPPGAGRSWEHHAVLLVHEVLKGECKETEIPIIIHYGLDPIVDGKIERDGPTTHPVARGLIRIEDTGGSGITESNVKDARQDNLWFLRRRSGVYGREPGGGDFGIVDPEDFKPLALKDYIFAFLSSDPETAVRKQIARQPEVAARAMQYLDQREIERITRIADPANRVERLIPYFMNPSTTYKAAIVIEAAGPAAGPYLLGVYDRTWDPNVRDRIIRLWGRVRWPGCADVLIDLLKTTDRYWGQQTLEPGWWNKDVDSRVTEQRHNQYGLVYYSVCTLHRLRIPRAQDAIELTRRRWAAINFENKQIVEECDTALKDLAALPPATNPAPASLRAD